MSKILMSKNHDENVHMIHTTCPVCKKKDEQIAMGQIRFINQCTQCGLKHIDPNKYSTKECKHCGGRDFIHEEITNHSGSIDLGIKLCEECENSTKHLILVNKSNNDMVVLNELGRENFLSQVKDPELVKQIKGVCMIDNKLFEQFYKIQGEDNASNPTT